MYSKIIKKILQKDYCSYNLDIADILIPLSQFMKNKKAQDIYNGNEHIPFNKKDPEFKKALAEEFLYFLR
ncbi:MAG: hypothetical protein ACFFAK_05360 [Promethearchaeota archaeon]